MPDEKPHRQATRRLAVTALLACLLLPSCTAAKTVGKVAAFPVVATYKTAEFGAKTTYGAGKLAGQGVWLAGKGVYKVGEGVYTVGDTTIRVTERALNTTSRILFLTTQIVMVTGQVATLTAAIEASQLQVQIEAFKKLGTVLDILVDVPPDLERLAG